MPPAAEAEEIQGKQEEAELRGPRRLPIKQRYQQQFKEVMRLKMEVRDLIRKVHRMQKKINKYKLRARKSKVIEVEAETKTDPIEQLFEAREYALMAKL